MQWVVWVIARADKCSERAEQHDREDKDRRQDSHDRPSYTKMPAWGVWTTDDSACDRIAPPEDMVSMTEKGPKPMLEYARPAKRPRWPWWADLLFGLAIIALALLITLALAVILPTLD